MPAKDLHLSKQARVRLGEVFDAFETHRKSRIAMMISYGERYLGPLESLGEAAARIVRRRFGDDIDAGNRDVKDFCLTATVQHLTYLVMGSFAYLRDLEGAGRLPGGTSHSFAEEVNEVVRADGFAMHFDEEKVGWTFSVSSDAEALRRALLDDPSDVAKCKQSDPQVEMVVSTVQAALARPDPVFVDYGAGLGRILLGFGTAERFRNVAYVAVDEPVSDDVKALAMTVGAKFVSTSREAFLKDPPRADVVILMNTLHHIPFDDLPRQMSTILGSLKGGGVLVIQEIGELRQPEQLNVPWRTEDIRELFDIPGCKPNPRSTTTRSQRIPLTHMLVHVEGTPPNQEILTEKCRAIWTRMKSRALDELREFYRSRNPEDEVLLQHTLITNANLDLNRPS